MKNILCQGQQLIFVRFYKPKLVQLRWEAESSIVLFSMIDIRNIFFCMTPKSFIWNLILIRMSDIKFSSCFCVFVFHGWFLWELPTIVSIKLFYWCSFEINRFSPCLLKINLATFFFLDCPVVTNKVALVILCLIVWLLWNKIKGTVFSPVHHERNHFLISSSWHWKEIFFCVWKTVIHNFDILLAECVDSKNHF